MTLAMGATTLAMGAYAGRAAADAPAWARNAPKSVRSPLDGAQTPRPRLSAVARFGGETNYDEAEDQNSQPDYRGDNHSIHVR